MRKLTMKDLVSHILERSKFQTYGYLLEHGDDVSVKKAEKMVEVIAEGCIKNLGENDWCTLLPSHKKIEPGIIVSDENGKAAYAFFAINFPEVKYSKQVAEALQEYGSIRKIYIFPMQDEEDIKEVFFDIENQKD